MLLIDHTDASLPDNLAMDEALLHDDGRVEALRLWEPARLMVVLGRSSRVEQEVDAKACEALGVSIGRRVSGGATIVTGPGCLMYAVVLNLGGSVDLSATHSLVLGKLAPALRGIDRSVQIAGTSDLAVERDGVLRKFSGNSVRVVRDRLLYHGTLLYDFDLDRIARVLRTPPRQPDYRGDRDHGAFVANLAVDRATLRRTVIDAWGAEPHELPETIAAHVGELATTKYATDAWTHSR